MDKEKLIQLANAYLNGEATDAEIQELHQWYDSVASGDDEELIISGYESAEQAGQRIFASIRDSIKHDNNSGGKLIPLLKRGWIRIAAAACILFLLGGAWYFLFNHRAGNEGHETVSQLHDVKAPVTNRATITLANGEVVYLDSANNGMLSKQGSISVRKLGDGEIVYEEGNEAERGNEALVYNTLTNPKGSKVIDMTLSDGSHVWLNAGSSIKYPVVFASTERKVEMNGEAYFEIAKRMKNEKLKIKNEEGERVPFIVSKGAVSVTVLGTHFNVNAYDDESDIKVTLLEGSVKVVNGQWSMVNGKKELNGQVKIIKPGEQAVAIVPSAGSGGQLTIESGVDVEQVMAWKNGFFSFSKADIKAIMNEVARWYDVDVVYTTDVKETFYLKAGRNISVSNIFKILETTGGVHLEIDGKKIIVKP